jgi:hypothetical protein
MRITSDEVIESDVDRCFLSNSLGLMKNMATMMRARIPKINKGPFKRKTLHLQT